MATIRKKIWPESFNLILSGQKKYDLRLADWQVNPGDTLILQEWEPQTSSYTGREVIKKVGYVGKTKDLIYWSKEEVDKYGFQVISLLD